MTFTTDGTVARHCLAPSGRNGRPLFPVSGALPLAMLFCPSYPDGTPNQPFSPVAEGVRPAAEKDFSPYVTRAQW